MKDLARRFVVRPGSRVKLARVPTDDTAGIKNREAAQPLLQENLRRLDLLQYMLYAEGKRALLVVLQAMDAGGKDGTIRHVMTGMNPQSCRVASFKKPTIEELSHDFLWRVHAHAPARGEVGIFNRSHYEDVLIVRVHDLVPKAVWKQRYDLINHFEATLAHCDTHVLKFFLHISKKEQTKRLRARVQDPTKHWKITEEDLAERKLWSAYQAAYEDALSRCSTTWAPWYIIPADHKWFRDLAVSQIIADTLDSLRMRFPEPKMDVSKIRI